MYEHLFPLPMPAPGSQTRKAKKILRVLKNAKVEVLGRPKPTTNANGQRVLRVIFRSEDDLDKDVAAVGLLLANYAPKN